MYIQEAIRIEKKRELGDSEVTGVKLVGTSQLKVT